MPQDGSNNYQYPPGTPGVPNQTIESEAYNTFLDDLVVNDLNIARPVHRGGTGAENKYDARQNLDIEVASQLVTNYDSHIWEAGSFYSDGTATAQPTAWTYVGIAMLHGTDNNYITLEAYQVTDGTKYLRQKVDGVWGSWVEQISSQASGDIRYVNLTGDTMTGSLNISAANPSFILNKATAIGGDNSLWGQTAGANRWEINLGTGIAESGSSVGSDFSITRYNDAGVGTSALGIARATGATTISGPLNVQGGTSVFQGPITVPNGNIYCDNGSIVTGQAGLGYIYFGQDLAHRIGYDGTKYFCEGAASFVAGGGITATGNVNANNGALVAGAASTGSIYLGQDLARSISWGGTQFIINGPVAVQLPSGGLPVYQFWISGVLQSYINDNGGSINVYSNAAGTAGMYISHGTSAWSALSDARLPMKVSGRPLSVLDKIDKIYLYENENPKAGGKIELFFKAQELYQAFPHLVAVGQNNDPDYKPKEDAEDPNLWGVSYDRSGAAALQGLKELLAIVENLKARIEVLEGAA